MPAETRLAGVWLTARRRNIKNLRTRRHPPRESIDERCPEPRHEHPRRLPVRLGRVHDRAAVPVVRVLPLLDVPQALRQPARPEPRRRTLAIPLAPTGGGGR